MTHSPSLDTDETTGELTSDPEGDDSNYQDGDIDASGDTENNAPPRSDPPFVTVRDDPELTALYRQLAEINDQILARWVALLASAPTHESVRRNDQDDRDDDDELDGPRSGGGSSSVQDSITRGVPASPLVPASQSFSHKRDHSQVDSGTSHVPIESEGQRRVSNRKLVQRIPYVSGSGGGLAPKNHNQTLTRRPATQRWFYDSTPASVPALAFEPPRSLNCSDAAAHHVTFQILNPPDSDDSEDSELNDDELVLEAIIESTCINTFDNWGEPAIAQLVSRPGFTILRTANGNALVLFPDRSFRVYIISDVDEAFHRLYDLGVNQDGVISQSQSGGSTKGESTTVSDLAIKGCLDNNLTSFNSPTPMVMHEIQFTDSDWVFLDPRDPFTINLHFPNALDPDNPSEGLSQTSLEVFMNQTVPNLYLRVSSITGVFPRNIRLLISDQILCHQGEISIDRSTNVDGVILNKCPPVTKDCIVTVLMLCEEGFPIPHGYNGFPVGFPASLPPGGTIRSYLGDDQFNEDMIEIYPDKYLAAVAAVPPVLYRRLQMARFNAQERYNRRLWVMEMKAVWDFQYSDKTDSHSSTMLCDSESQMQLDLAYASYLDYMNDRLALYDADYRTRAIAFKEAMTDQDSVSRLTALDRARIDSESLLRQART